MSKLALTACVFACAGCALLKSDEGWGGGGGSGSYTTDGGTVSRGLAVLNRDNRPYLVVLSAGSATKSVKAGRAASGTIQAPDSRTVEWTCVTKDGVTGTVTVGDRKLRLENGGLILVDLRGGQTVVEQAAVNVGRLEGAAVEDRLKVMAATDERVARFLNACESPR
jgi:hypothetical protein